MVSKKRLDIALLFIILKCKITHLHVHVHVYTLMLIFLQKFINKSENIAFLDRFVFDFQNILGSLVSYFLEMIIFFREVCL